MKQIKKLIYTIIILTLIICINSKSKITIETKEESSINQSLNQEQLKTNFSYYQKLYKNDDIIARLEIPEIFNILIVQGSDNEFYLSHNLYKDKDIKGTEFIDFRNNLNDQQINIYGHNSKTFMLPFRQLEKYLDEDFFLSHDIIYFETANYLKEFKIFSIKEVTTSFEHMKINIEKGQFLEHLNKLKENSINSQNINFNEFSNILILQTCSFNQKDSYYIISAIELN